MTIDDYRRWLKLIINMHFKFTTLTSSKDLLDLMLLPVEFASLKFVWITIPASKK